MMTFEFKMTDCGGVRESVRFECKKDGSPIENDDSSLKVTILPLKITAFVTGGSLRLRSSLIRKSVDLYQSHGNIPPRMFLSRFVLPVAYARDAVCGRCGRGARQPAVGAGALGEHCGVNALDSDTYALQTHNASCGLSTQFHSLTIGPGS